MQANINEFVLKHGISMKKCFLLFWHFSSKMEKKESYHGGFQQQSSQGLFDIYVRNPASGVVFNRVNNF